MSGIEGKRILLDGFNIDLKHGTGIQSYGYTLLGALERAGARSAILFARTAIRRKQVIDEISFFDAPHGSDLRRREWPGHALRAMSGMASLQKIDLSDRVIHKDFPVDRVYNRPHCFLVANNLYRKAWRLSRYRAAGVDLWHATYPLPIRIAGAPMVTTVHDLIPLRLPYTSLDDKEFFYRLVKRSIRDSRVVLAVSENTKRDMVEFFHCDPEKIVVTHQPVPLFPDAGSGPSTGKVLARHGLVPGNYILYVGNIEPKKNVGRLIQAYSEIDTDVPLVIVGKKAWLWEEDLKKSQGLLGWQERRLLRILDYLPRHELRVLLDNAMFFAFPSLYEGFGLPPLEAMSRGCPVLTSHTSSLPEVCGDAALYVDPYSKKEIRRNLEAMLGDGELRERLGKAGRERVKKLFSGQKYLEKIVQAYERAL